MKASMSQFKGTEESSIQSTNGRIEVHVSTIAYCWGIDLAMKRIAGATAKGGIEATHRWSPKPDARRWDPLELVKQRDARLLQAYPGLSNVIVVEKLGDVASDRIALGHHGTVEPKTHAGTAEILDYTCPFIAKSDHRAQTLAEAGYDLLLFGKPGNHHCEFAKSTAERAGRVGIIGESVAYLRAALLEPGRNWACLGQVTANVWRWQAFKDDLLDVGVPVRIVESVCSDSYDRQAEGIKLAEHCDIVVLVNDHGGSTKSLFELCQAANPGTYLYDPFAGDLLDPGWFHGVRSVAVVGGIHVPKWVLDEVATDIRQMGSGI